MEVQCTKLHLLIVKVFAKLIQCKNSQTILSDRQKEMLNIWLDGYEGKLTAKNWSKLSKKSLDTALRDIKDLVDKQILRPKDGNQRNIEYEIL